MKSKHSDKTFYKALNLLFNKLQLCQRALGKEFMGENALRTNVIRACRGVPELKQALFKSARGCEKLFSDLRSFIQVELSEQQFFHLKKAARMNYTDRTYNNNRRNPRFARKTVTFARSPRSNYQNQASSSSWKKKCFVCQKKGCWFIRHTPEERRKSKSQFLIQGQMRDKNLKNYQTYLLDYESIKDSKGDNPNDFLIDFDDDYENLEFVSYMMDQAFMYRATRSSIYSQSPFVNSSDSAPAD
jgi:hypothetical protein